MVKREEVREARDMAPHCALLANQKPASHMID